MLPPYILLSLCGICLVVQRPQLNLSLPKGSTPRVSCSLGAFPTPTHGPKFTGRSLIPLAAQLLPEARPRRAQLSSQMCSITSACTIPALCLWILLLLFFTPNYYFFLPLKTMYAFGVSYPVFRKAEWGHEDRKTSPQPPESPEHVREQERGRCAAPSAWHRAVTPHALLGDAKELPVQVGGSPGASSGPSPFPETRG